MCKTYLQKVMEEKFKSRMTELETRLASGHRELEASLESEIRRNGAKLEDMDDRYARSEEALRRAEERIGEVQEEVRKFGHILIHHAWTELPNTEPRGWRWFTTSYMPHPNRLSSFRPRCSFVPFCFLPRSIAPLVFSNRCMR